MEIKFEAVIQTENLEQMQAAIMLMQTLGGLSPETVGSPTAVKPAAVKKLKGKTRELTETEAEIAETLDVEKLKAEARKLIRTKIGSHKTAIFAKMEALNCASVSEGTAPQLIELKNFLSTLESQA